MSQMRWVGLFAVTFVGVMVLHALAQDSKSPDSSDPASDIIDGLLKQLDQPKQAKKPARSSERGRVEGLSNPVASATPESIIDGVASRADESASRKAKNAALLFEQAKAAQREGKWPEAIRLANSAKRMNPQSKEIAEFAASLQKEVGAKSSVLPTQTRAVARLAAAVARGQELMAQGRYARAMDLLTHAEQATSLFPPEIDVSTYRKMAEREIQAYRQRLERGEIQPDEQAPAGDEPVLVATGSAAPTNARRILRAAEAATPTWYAQTKNRLAFVMTVNYSRVPFATIIDELSKATGVKLMIDETVVRSRTLINTVVDFRIADVSAERVLDLACSQAGLEYLLMERGVIVTTPSRAVRYLRDLPDSVRDNWLAARVLFPEMTPELLASPALPNAVPGQALVEEDELDADVPVYLRSGKALLADLTNLLRAK